MNLEDFIVDSNVLIDYFGVATNYLRVRKYFETSSNLFLNPMIVAETYNYLFNRLGSVYALNFNEWLLNYQRLTVIELTQDNIFNIVRQKNLLKNLNLSLTDWSIILQTREHGIRCITTDNLLISYAYGMAQLP